MSTRSFPLNAWYAAAWSSEICHELAARKIGERDLVVYRKQDGEVVALEDACWHRLLPLSMGKLDGDQVMCGYHGLQIRPPGPLRAHAGAGNHQSVGVCAGISRGRALSPRLGMDGQSGHGRSRSHSGFSPER